MAVDHIRYDLLTQDALRAVVRQVLVDAAKKGLPGEHHFYISFFTNAEGVKISPRLREQYPDEITIILQHQFWDLIVREDQFEVGLSFGGVPERLTIPFAAIKGFFDPSVQFGLQFETVASGEEAAAAEDAPKGQEKPSVKSAKLAPAQPPQIAGNAQTSVPSVPADKAPDLKVVDATAADGKETDAKEGGGKENGGAEVVRLDRFRKK